MQVGETLIDKIYEAGLVPELWPALLSEVTSLLGGVGSVLIADGGREQQVACSTGFETVISGYIEEGWSECNQRFDRAVARRLPAFLTEQDLFTQEEIVADPMLQGYFLPRGLGRELGAVLAATDGGVLLLTVQRRFSDGPPSAQVMDLANALRPHLARAATISARIGLDRAKVTVDALQSLGRPVATLNARGQAIAMNPLFRDAIPSIVVERRGRIALSDLQADDLLAKVIFRPPDRGVEPGALSIPTRDTGTGACTIAHLVPVRRSALDMFAAAAFILLLSPVARPVVLDASLLKGLFDLTPAEVRLCSALAHGSRNLPQVAKDVGLSYYTVKTQLKTIFQKTGSRSQAELMRLIVGLGH